MENIVHTFEPVYDKKSKVLILGTFPSVKSREGQFYYHNPQNRFWKLISMIVDEPCPQTIYDKRKLLLRNNIAVWDVIKSCNIKGSSDSSIKNVIPADLSYILKNADIKNIYANGGMAYKLYMKHSYPITGRDIRQLPSTSPANARFSLGRLFDEWKCLRFDLQNN